MKFSNTEYEAETFENLVLPGLHVERKAFYDCQFDYCQFVEASLKGSSFTHCTFTNCDLSMIDVTGAEFTDTRFENSVAVAVNWALMAQNPHLGAGLDFSACMLKYAVFNGLDLRGRSFLDCLAQEVDFSHAILASTDFAGTDLQGAEFTHCDLTKANFVTASNYQINVLNNKVKGARFSVSEALGLLAGLGIKLEL